MFFARHQDLCGLLEQHGFFLSISIWRFGGTGRHFSCFSRCSVFIPVSLALQTPKLHWLWICFQVKGVSFGVFSKTPSFFGCPEKKVGQLQLRSPNTNRLVAPVRSPCPKKETHLPTMESQGASCWFQGRKWSKCIFSFLWGGWLGGTQPFLTQGLLLANFETCVIWFWVFKSGWLSGSRCHFSAGFDWWLMIFLKLYILP